MLAKETHLTPTVRFYRNEILWMCCRIGNSYMIVELCRFVSGDVWCKVLSKENISACISLHSAVTLEAVIVTLLSASDPVFYGIRWFDTAFSSAHLSTVFQHSPYTIYVSRISKIIVAFLANTHSSPTRPFCSGFFFFCFIFRVYFCVLDAHLPPLI